MTQPNPDQGNAGNGSPDPGTSTAKPVKGIKVLDVVEFTRHDPIINREHRGFGVVVRTGKENESVAIRPLHDHHLEIDAADITAVSADDVG